MNETYLYPYSAAEANKRNEMALWRESHKANIACRNAIEETIRQNFNGMNLKEKCIQPVLDEYGYAAQYGANFWGTKCEEFGGLPLLIKLIDAKTNLSIQVHPDNAYALEHEHQYGKTEMWYVMEAAPDAYLYYGLKKSVTKGELSKSITDGTIIDLLRAVPVHAGDLFFIPAGTIHAICGGTVIAEIQQNSNVTYRVFDYNRIGKDGKTKRDSFTFNKRLTSLI